jgi:predicted RNA-binding protein with PIN domain
MSGRFGVARQYLLIDGYNLLHAAGLARDRYGPGQFEKCRQRLLQELADRLSGEQRELTTVIFDAQDAPPDAPSVQQFAKISVVYSVGSDADSMIEAMLASHASPRQVLVVSSDHRLQKAAAARRAKSIDSDTFWEQEFWVECDTERSTEQQLKHGERNVDAAEVAEIVRRLKSEAGGVGGVESLGDGARRKSETVTDHYERELTERAEEALREWNEGPAEGLGEAG